MPHQQQFGSKIDLVKESPVKSIRRNCNRIFAAEDETGQSPYSAKERDRCVLSRVEDAGHRKIPNYLLHIRGVVVEPTIRPNCNRNFGMRGEQGAYGTQRTWA